MDELSSDDISFARQWMTMCGMAQSSAMSMAAMFRGVAADLILQETRKFCTQDPPRTRDELSLRQQQIAIVNERVFAIAHADSMAAMFRGVAADLILQETRRLCAQDLPRTRDELSLRQRQIAIVNERISAIANADLMASMVTPSAADEIFREMRDFCETALPLTEIEFREFHTVRAGLTSKISSICSADAMSHLGRQ